MAKLIPVKTRHDIYGEKPIIELTGLGNQLCYEESAGRWFRSSQECVKKDLILFQEMYKQESYVSEADLHDCLGIRTITKDFDYGWSVWIHDNIKLIETEFVPNGFKGMDESVLVIKPTIPPVKDYAD